MKSWITREGKLGGPGFTQKPTQERRKILKRCVDEYGYRSCLGSVQVLLRSSELKDKTKKVLESDSNWLEKEFGGPGSFTENPMNTREQFFYNYAGHSWPTGASEKEKEKAKVDWAKTLVAAEKWAEEEGYTFVWEDDPEGWLDDDDSEFFEVLALTMKDPNGNVIDSLGGISMSKNSVEARRQGEVFEAEMAYENMPDEVGVGVYRNPRHMSKAEFERMFKEEVLPQVVRKYGPNDKPARREAWNDLVDAEVRAGMLPEKALDWSQPRWVETYRVKAENPATQRNSLKNKLLR